MPRKKAVEGSDEDQEPKLPPLTGRSYEEAIEAKREELARIRASPQDFAPLDLLIDAYERIEGARSNIEATARASGTDPGATFSMLCQVDTEAIKLLSIYGAWPSRFQEIADEDGEKLSSAVLRKLRVKIRQSRPDLTNDGLAALRLPEAHAILTRCAALNDGCASVRDCEKLSPSELASRGFERITITRMKTEWTIGHDSLEDMAYRAMKDDYIYDDYTIITPKKQRELWARVKR
jgi:hypothetical protein